MQRLLLGRLHQLLDQLEVAAGLLLLLFTHIKPGIIISNRQTQQHGVFGLFAIRNTKNSRNCLRQNLLASLLLFRLEAADVKTRQYSTAFIQRICANTPFAEYRVL